MYNYVETLVWSHFFLFSYRVWLIHHIVTRLLNKLGKPISNDLSDMVTASLLIIIDEILHVHTTYGILMTTGN